MEVLWSWLGSFLGIALVAWLNEAISPLLPWLAAALAVSTAIAVMHLTRTLHPPGGATALIAVIGSEQVHAMGYLFVLIPVTLGALLMLLVALLVNNLASARRYPEFWL